MDIGMYKCVRLQLVLVDMVWFNTEHLYLYIYLSCVVIMSALIGIKNAHLGDQHLKLLPCVRVCVYGCVVEFERTIQKS